MHGAENSLPTSSRQRERRAGKEGARRSEARRFDSAAQRAASPGGSGCRLPPAPRKRRNAHHGSSRRESGQPPSGSRTMAGGHPGSKTVVASSRLPGGTPSSLHFGKDPGPRTKDHKKAMPRSVRPDCKT
uniref:Uncharacterized protein n=1 Tax=Sphaerodactylus townsendi TaxID=933632 RepID=A0ACB8EQA2_9SAUR